MHILYDIEMQGNSYGERKLMSRYGSMATRRRSRGTKQMAQDKLFTSSVELLSNAKEEQEHYIMVLISTR